MPSTSQTDAPFWERIPLEAMTPAQWESLCDGCAKCCLQKYQDEDTGRIHYTNVACFLLDQTDCHCSDYANRSKRVSDCVTLTLEVLRDPSWLPETCAYRLLREGKPLAPWHPLVSGDPESVARAGHSVRGRVVCETQTDDPLMHLIDWIR